MVVPGETPVDLLYRNFQEVIAGIDPMEVSLRGTLEVHFSKSLLMAVAGYFEEQVQHQVLAFVDSQTSGNELVKELILRRSFGRQYSSLFEWKAKNANYFFAFFGREFSQSMRQYVSEHDEYQDAARAFLEVGNARNELAHGSYAQFPLDKTIEEIYQSYQLALPFVNSISDHLTRVSAEITSTVSNDGN